MIAQREHIDTTFTGQDGTRHIIRRVKTPTGRMLVDDWEGRGTRLLMDIHPHEPASEEQIQACVADYRCQASLAIRPLSRPTEAYVPTETRYARRIASEAAAKARNERVLKAFLRGDPWEEIATDEGLSEPTARMIVSRLRKNDPTIPRRKGGRQQPVFA